MLLKRAVLVLFGLFCSWIFFELAARLLLKPGYASEKSLLGLDLPPLRLVPIGGAFHTDTGTIWKERGKPNPLNVTKGDLWGILREDPRLGYVFLENSRSVNGWWQSNNIGARTAAPTEPQIAPGKHRVFVFGESYGHASRVRQDEAWSTLLALSLSDTEIVNMAVDGFGMGQAYLRYLGVRDSYDCDAVCFVFVPESDLWRDVNTMRYLAEGWEAYTIVPRMALNDGRLTEVQGPYRKGSDIYRLDSPVVTPAVREHLRRYDRFYEPLLYESHWCDFSIGWRLLARMLGNRRHDAVYRACASRLDCEAMAVDATIFLTVQREQAERGRKFLLLMLPDPEVLDEVRRNPSSPRLAVWNARIAWLAARGLAPLDLMPRLRALPSDQVDRGYDGTHYGPKVNRAWAGWVRDSFAALRYSAATRSPGTST